MSDRDELEELKRKIAEKEKELKKLLGGNAGDSMDLLLGRFASRAQRLSDRAARIVPSDRDLAMPKHRLTRPTGELSPGDRAALLLAQGRYAEAEAIITNIIASIREQHGPDHPTMVSPMNKLAAIHISRGEHTQAEKLFRDAIRILQQRGDERDQSALRATQENLLSVLISVDKLQEAEQMCQEGIAYYQRIGKPTCADVASLLMNIASIRERQDRLGESEAFLKRALDLAPRDMEIHETKSAQGFGVFFRGGIFNSLGSLCIKQGRLEEAERYLEKALGLGIVQLGDRHPVMVSVFNNMARLREAQGREPEATEYRKKASLATPSMTSPRQQPGKRTGPSSPSAVSPQQQAGRRAEPSFEIRRIKGAVINVFGTSLVEISPGSSAGISKGMMFQIERDSQKVCRIHIDNVDTAKATGTVYERKLNPQVGDVAVRIY